ncbi:hypothetical protein PI126_g18228 [Phytophthora idaei]|nr:hypothetical protein PI126_g18228 [Phytophthora idaei]
MRQHAARRPGHSISGSKWLHHHRVRTVPLANRWMLYKISSGFGSFYTNITINSGIPASEFSRISPPIVHVHMGSSDDSLRALEPALWQYIRLQFSDAKKTAFRADLLSNSINEGELPTAVLAVLRWVPVWARQFAKYPIRVCFWIDNAGAVSWTRRRATRQPLAQLYNRLISMAEFCYTLDCAAAHVPGVENTISDAGSGSWIIDNPLYGLWSDFSLGWQQVQDNLSQLWE